MSNPNDIQIDGDHYKSSDYQHWDMLARMGFGWEYYIGCATKYLTRWHKKAGVKDLRKAHHFVIKLQDLVRTGQVPKKFNTANLLRMGIDLGPVNSRTISVEDDLIDYFAKNTVANENTEGALTRLMSARDLPDLEIARITIELILNEVDPPAVVAAPPAVVAAKEDAALPDFKDVVYDPPSDGSDATNGYVDQ